MPDLFVEIDFVPTGEDGDADHADWHCQRLDCESWGLVLYGTATGHDRLIIPYNNIRSIGISDA